MTFKLDRLASENGFAVHKAHDAVGDIEATIYIAPTYRGRRSHALVGDA